MITLPVIHTLSTPLTSAERKHIGKTLSNGSSKNDIKQLKEIITEHGGFEYAHGRIKDFSAQAIDALRIFPDSPYKRSLVDLTVLNENRTC